MSAAALALVASSLALAGMATAIGERRRGARRSELVQRACHELRGPLTAARLGLHLAAGAPSAAAAGPLAAVDQELRRAGLALADLAAAPRGGRERDRAETVYLEWLLRCAALAWGSVAERAGARVELAECPRGLVVAGDRARLAQAVGNLLANAIEHGGGKVELSARRAGAIVRIEVRDEGPGLPARVDRLSRRPRRGRGCRGHGLAIAADVARRHGGHLGAAPSARGARLVLELPALDPDGATA